MKPFKISLIHINDSFDASQVSQMNQDIKKLELKLSLEDIYNAKKQLLTTLQAQKQIQIWHYIFIGFITDDIRDIVDIIEDFEDFDDDEEDPVGEDNISVLNSYFKYDVTKEWDIRGIIQKKYSKVQFIPISIDPTHNISTIKEIITQSIDTSNPLGERIYPEHQCMIADLFNYNSIDEIQKNVHSPYSLIHTDSLKEDVQYTPEKILLHNIYINKSNIPINEQLETIGIDIEKIIDGTFEHAHELKKCITYIQDERMREIVTDDSCYEMFIHHPYLLLYANKYLTSKICYYSFISDDKSIYMDPFLLFYLDTSFKGYETLYDKRWKKKSNDKLLLQNIGTINDNNVYIYTFKNVYNFIKGLATYDEDIVKRGFLKKYFPTIKLDNLDYDFSRTYNTKQIIEDYTYHKQKLNELEKPIKNNTIIVQKISFLNKSNFKKDIDLLELFNTIRLHNDIPFVKFKDIESYSGKRVTYNYIYKIYRPSFNLNNNNYKINRDKITSHKKYEDNICLLEVERNISEGAWISLKTNGLLYKIIVGYKPKDILLLGTIIEQTIQHILIEHNENNKIKIFRIPKLLHNRELNIKSFIPDYTGTEKNTDVVSFYDIDIIYGNIDIDRKSNIKLNVFLKKSYNYDITYIHTLNANVFQTFIAYLQSLSISFYNNYNIIKPNINVFYINQVNHQSPMYSLYNSSIHNLNVLYTTQVDTPTTLQKLKLGFVVEKYGYSSFQLIYNNIFYIGDTVNYRNSDGTILKGKIVYYDDIKKNT